MMNETGKKMKQWYLDNMGKTVKVGRFKCEVISRQKEGKSGSWERGFKFTTSVYGGLRRDTTGAYLYSFDHGLTWMAGDRNAIKVRAGKTLLKRSTQGEMAFNSIQEINRKWDSGYKWKP